MKPRITVITLGVDDLERALRFYSVGLGLPTEGIVGRKYEHGAVISVELDGGLVLALRSRLSIGQEAHVPQTASGPTDVCISHDVDSKHEVDEVMAQAKRAGATITDAARDRFWGGYAGYFQDPDGHVWEVVWNPDAKSD